MNDKTVREIIAEYEERGDSPLSLGLRLNGLRHSPSTNGWRIEIFTDQADAGDLDNEEPEPMFMGPFLNKLGRELWWSRRQDRNRHFAEWAEKRGKAAQRKAEKNAYYWAP